MSAEGTGVSVSRRGWRQCQLKGLASVSAEGSIFRRTFCSSCEVTSCILTFSASSPRTSCLSWSSCAFMRCESSRRRDRRSRRSSLDAAACWLAHVDSLERLKSGCAWRKSGSSWVWREDPHILGSLRGRHQALGSGCGCGCGCGCGSGVGWG